MTLKELKTTPRWQTIKRTLFFDTEFVGEEKNFSDLSKIKQEAIIYKWLKNPYDTEFKELMEQKKTTPSKYWQEKAGLTDFTKIICMSVGYIDSNDELILKSLRRDKCKSDKEFCEKMVVTLNKITTWKAICAHSVFADIRAIAKECIRNGVGLPLLISPTLRVQPWNLNAANGIVFCTNKLAQTIYGNLTRLTDLCAILGVNSPKDGIDGSMIHKAYWNGKDQEIADYCERDVKALFECFCKLIIYI